MNKSDEQSFSVFPMNQTVELMPGNTYYGIVNVANTGDTTNNLVVKAEKYNAVNRENHEDSGAAYSQIVDWIKIDEPKIKVEPNETHPVKFTIEVPSDAAGGGQYAVIAVYQDQEAGETGGLQVQSQFAIGSIIYADVDGEILRGGEIVDNSFPSFVLDLPVKATARLTNDGNVHETAVIQLTVKNQITGEQIFPVTDQQKLGWTEIVLPDSTQVATRELTGLPTVGVVWAEQTVHFEGQVSTVAHTIVICPVWFIVLMTLILAGIVGGIVAGVRYHRKKKLAL